MNFERNVITSGRRLRDKGIEIGKREIEDVPLIDALPRHTAAADTPALSLVADEEAGEDA